jgi:rifampicin phosphotransferase
LSHAAVICREYGIPAVLGVENATQRLRAGDEVVVWGDAGLVETDSEPYQGDH